MGKTDSRLKCDILHFFFGDWLIYKGLRLVNVEIQLSYYMGVLVTVWLIINELISILENLGAVGVPLPGFLQKLIKRLKQTVDKEDIINDKNA